MTRDEFSAGITSRLRFVLQKQEREVEARAAVRHAGGRGWDPRADAALEHATLMTDAAIDQVADHVFDAIETLAQHRGVIGR